MTRDGFSGITLRRWFLSWPLRTHLVLMATFLALPAILLIIHSGLNRKEEFLRQGIVTGSRFLSDIATEQYDITGNVEQLVTVLAQLPEITRRDAAAAGATLAGILGQNTHFANILVADRNGEVWASALPLKGRLSVAERRSFRKALSTRRLSSGEYHVDFVSSRSTIGFGYPVTGRGGEVGAVILVSLNFRDLRRELPGVGLPRGAVYSIIDRNGIIIERSEAPESSIGRKVRRDFFQRIENGPVEGHFIETASNGEQFIYCYRKLSLAGEESPYLSILASFPLKEIRKQALHALFVNIAILTPFLLVTMLLVLRLGNFCFVNRIDRLREAAQRLAEGDLGTSVSGAVSGGELGDLALAFDDMARRLAIRERELLNSERKLSELNQNLAKRVEEETGRRLQHERLLARHARLAALGEMIGAIAHQWRQPLATVGATIQSIRMATERDCLDPEFLQKAEQDAQKQLYYMSDTIEDFRNFFRPDKVMERFDAVDKVREAALLLSSQASRSGISLQVVDRSGGERLEIRGYQNEFKQAMLNLIANSFDAIIEKQATNGGGSFDGAVAVTLSGDGTSAVIEVRDNGCGIPPEYGDKVFEPYFTTKGGGKGTGIGLYMSRLIIEESMAGSLRFTSGPDGTTFRIVLERSGTREGESHD